ncbi:uncharacterized protein H6S33_000220 [Morchella sextelata]|uniref:uncharacterized protein n=1 Tax=Morchella sextelata TaxID=1174677 RepID=UPI001D057464|nr:uncharacterized protein H6S33_000220 [Morchella sextelata]KAH0614584.1 hypothetical protein H6S33_000220 [Morchella sextelata]
MPPRVHPLFNPADVTPRKALPPSKQPRTTRRQLGRYEKGMIIALYHTMQNISQVANIMRRPWKSQQTSLPTDATIPPPTCLDSKLKKRLQIQYPQIKDTPGGPDKVRERLAEVLPLVWDTIPEEFFEKLWRSMPDRVAAVIEAREWYTKY